METPQVAYSAIDQLPDELFSRIFTILCEGTPVEKVFSERRGNTRQALNPTLLPVVMTCRRWNTIINFPSNAQLWCLVAAMESPTGEFLRRPISPFESNTLAKFKHTLSLSHGCDIFVQYTRYLDGTSLPDRKEIRFLSLMLTILRPYRKQIAAFLIDTGENGIELLSRHIRASFDLPRLRFVTFQLSGWPRTPPIAASRRNHVDLLPS
jgi:hypothetical protein